MEAENTTKPDRVTGGGAVLSQACVRQPVRADLVFRERGLTTECFRHWAV